MECPTCGLVSPPTAQRCDCGYDFVERRQKQPLVPASRSYKLSGWAKLGILFGICGFVILATRGLNRVVNPTERSSTESSGIGYWLGSLLGELFVALVISALIAWPIIWLIDRGRKRRLRTGPR
jgi:hypothetical protein